MQRSEMAYATKLNGIQASDNLLPEVTNNGGAKATR